MHNVVKMIMKTMRNSCIMFFHPFYEFQTYQLALKLRILILSHNQSSIQTTLVIYSCQLVEYEDYIKQDRFNQMMKQTIMTQEMEIVIDSDYANSKKSSNFSNREQQIFNDYFKVTDMLNPIEYLPQYQQNQIHQRAFVEDCNSCCGNGCILCAYPFACCCCKCCCIYELPTSTAGIVEEFGKFNRFINPGLNLINPCTEEIREIDMRIKILTPGNNLCITKDNVKVTIASSLAYRINNPIQAYYVLGNQLQHALVEATHSGLRNIVGQSTLDQLLTQRAKIIYSAKKLVEKNVPAGVTIENVFLEDIVVPVDTMRALSSAARQKRLSQANIINSKADVESASLLKQAASLLDTKAAMQIRYLEMVTQLGKKGSKLLMPIGVNKQGFKS